MTAWPWPFIMNGHGAFAWSALTDEQRRGCVPIWIVRGTL